MYIKQVRYEPQQGHRQYYHELPAVKALASLGALKLSAPVTFLVGENGSGKSTLLEAIAVAAGFNPEGGSKNFSFSTSDTHSGLWEELRLVRGPLRERDGFFLRAESFYNVATDIERMDAIPAGAPSVKSSYGGESLHEMSHGEAFLALVLNRLGGSGLYLFDEPEAALSPANQLTLLAAVHELVGKNSQLIIATHSPMLMAYPGAEILALAGDEIRSISYQETEHYRITKQFILNPGGVLGQLLE